MISASTVLHVPGKASLRGHVFFLGLAFLGSLALTVLSGCGIGSVDHTLTSEPVRGVALQGNVHGGNNPVTGSIIQLYEVEADHGENGYPGDSGFTAAKPLLSGITSGPGGNFSITNDYTCDNVSDDVYITATGGNPGLSDGSNNPALVLMAALGPCNGLSPSTFININEVTTIASAYALAQFAGLPSSGTGIVIGTSESNAPGLTRAFATVNNLVDIGIGQALTITPAYASNSVPSFNTSTVPQARINTLANILSLCVNSTGSTSSGMPCQLLFSAATPSGGTAPADTLQAALNIAQHPGSHVSDLYALANGNAAFQPSLPTPGPNDWTLALTFTGGGLGFAYNSGYQLTDTSMDIDNNGNIWVAAYNMQNISSSSMVAMFDNLGAPLTTISSEVIPSTGPPIVNYGGYHPYDAVQNNGKGVDEPVALVLDQNGNAWIGSNVGGLSVVSPDLSLEFTDPGRIGGIANTFPWIAIDGSGNAWVTGSKAIGEYDNSGSIQSPSSGWTGGAPPYTNWYGNPSYPTLDSNGNLWATDTNYGDFYRIDTSNGQLIYDYYQSNGPGATPIVADGSGNVYACNKAKTAFVTYNASSNSPGATLSATGRCGTLTAIDGFGHLWAYNSSALDELTTNNTVLSPANGFTGTSSGEHATIFGSTSMAVDGSGNLWVLNGNTGNNTVTTNSLVEFVGLAGPVLTPHSLALQDVELATRP